jgi:hypothetical protein
MCRVARHRREFFILLTLLSCYGYFLPRWASWNENSRLDLTLAIVDRGTLNIDDYYANTGDYAVINGHHYSDKAPGASFLAVPVYAAARPILRSAAVQPLLDRLARGRAFASTLKEGGTGLLAEKVYRAVVLYLITLVVVAVPSAALGVLLYRHLAFLTGGHDGLVSAVLLYGLATPAFPFSGSFFAHQIVAFLLFGAFHIVCMTARGRAAPGWAAVAGLMLGYAVITEYPAAMIAAAVTVYGLAVLPNRRCAGALGLGAIPPLCLLMAYDWAIAGTVLPVGYLHSALYTEVHGQGFISLVGPALPALWGITFGSFRGLFFVSPVLLLAVPGLVRWWCGSRQRAEFSVALWAVASFLVFNASSVMWQGGFSIGPRYLLPMLPFMALGLGVFLAGRAGRWRWFVVPLGGWSVFAVWAETLGGQSFPDWTPNPLFNYSIPHLMNGNVARNLGMALGLPGLWSLLPLLSLLALLAALWRLAERACPHTIAGGAGVRPTEHG